MRVMEAKWNMKNAKKRGADALGAAIVALVFAIGSASAYGAESTQAAPAPAAKNEGEKKEVRNFYEVLQDLVSDFEYDLKNGEVEGLKNIAIRNIATSENIPPSFRSHLELVITERILKTTKSRILQCLPCRAKRTTLDGDQVVITSAETNPVELSRIAKMAGIDHFMDVAFSYQPSGMVLSMYITEPEGGSIIWSRSYNSETSRASAFRRGVDYSQIDDARRQMEYTPTLQFRGTVMYMFQPDSGSVYTGCLGFGFRMVERYNNRKQEVGFETNYFLDTSMLMGAPADATRTPLYQSFNLTLLFIHVWNLIGEEENFNKARGSIFAGVGGTYALPGFLGGLVRAGYEWRLAKHWAVNGSVGYRPPGTFFIGGESAGEIHGVEFGLGISGLF